MASAFGPGKVTMPGDFPISLNDVQEAEAALRTVAVRTPLLENPDVNDALGGRFLIKVENVQRTGAFKIRGAYWRLRNMSRGERARGALTYSSGNHALGVAQAARILGTTALIVMPDDAPPAKIAAVRALGADIVPYSRDAEDYADVVARLQNETGRVHVPPSADPLVMAGAGTVSLEIFEQCNARGITPDAILTPCGGGGLTASTAVVAQALSPGTEVFAVEPAQFDDTRRSLAAGRRVANPKGRRTICDAIMTPIPNDVTFPINQALLAGGLVANDTEVRTAMRFAFEHFKIVIEPGAAVGIAAVLNKQIDIRGRRIVTVVTGGNISEERFCALINPGTG